MKEDDKFGATVLIIGLSIAILYSAYHVGRWHQNKLSWKANCEPPIVCQKIKGKLECWNSKAIFN